jgi:hypothetical protein
MIDEEGGQRKDEDTREQEQGEKEGPPCLACS